MTIAVTICATRHYTFAMQAQARRVAACVRLAKVEPGHIILVGDKSRELGEVVKHYEQVMPEGWKITHCPASTEADDTHANYKQSAQMLIASLRTVAFTIARKFGVDFCWSLDSDVLPPANALRCSLDMLAFDGGYYDIAQCPYPNGGFLGGRGTPEYTIAPNIYPDERIVPARLQRIYDENERRLKGQVVPFWSRQFDLRHPWVAANWWTPEDAQKNPNMAPSPDNLKRTLEREMKRRERLLKRIEKCPPKGNVFALNAVRWRKRGWHEDAYPGIGKGAVVPTDWVGFGCTLMTARALALATFEGYEGHGTEDLWVVWRCWYPAGLRLCNIPHCLCDHVIWDRKHEGGAADKFVLVQAFHETEGECVGHCRTRAVPWAPEFGVDPKLLAAAAPAPAQQRKREGGAVVAKR